MTLRFLPHVAAAVLVTCFVAPRLDARPGGGQGYSGRSSGRSSGSSSSSHSYSSSSSSGQSGGSGSAVTASADDPLVWISFIVIVVCVVGYVVVNGIGDTQRRRAAGETRVWDSREARPARSEPPLREGPEWRQPKNAFALVRQADPEFSAVLFDDFVYGLYAAAYLASHNREALALLAPYLSPAVRESLQARTANGRRVQSVVVGAMRVLGARANPPEPERRSHEVKVEIESNVTMVVGTESPTADYLKEVWILSRSAQAHTRPWKGARTFGCPACGAPMTSTSGGRCASCGQVMENGRFDWQVTSAEVLEAEPRPPALTGEVEERGTDLPTVMSPSFSVDWEALTAADSSVTQQSIAERLADIFSSLHASWGAQDLRAVRPFVSDALFQYLQYWIDAYRSQGLRNAVEKARITRFETARVARDLHYDAVTLRVFATGFEVTTNAATGEVVGGSRRRERPYSEYWTLIRGAEVRGRPPRAQACPGCGAALEINMAGSCAYCGVHVTAGEFDWVLSRIEQDDSYSG